MHLKTTFDEHSFDDQIGRLLRDRGMEHLLWYDLKSDIAIFILRSLEAIQFEDFGLSEEEL